MVGKSCISYVVSFQDLFHVLDRAIHRPMGLIWKALDILGVRFRNGNLDF